MPGGRAAIYRAGCVVFNKALNSIFAASRARLPLRAAGFALGASGEQPAARSSKQESQASEPTSERTTGFSDSFERRAEKINDSNHGIASERAASGGNSRAEIVAPPTDLTRPAKVQENSALLIDRISIRPRRWRPECCCCARPRAPISSCETGGKLGERRRARMQMNLLAGKMRSRSQQSAK